MAAAALGLCLVAVLLLGVVRVASQRRRTGESGLRFGSPRRGSLPHETIAAQSRRPSARRGGG